MKTIRVFLLGLICLLNSSLTQPGEKEFLDYYHKALEYFNSLDYKQAVDYLNRSIALNPRFDSAYYLRAQINYLQLNNTEAIKDCDRTLQINDRYSLAYLTKGICIALTDVLSDSIVQQVTSHRGDTAYFRKFRERYWLSEGSYPGLFDMGTSIDVFTKAISTGSTNAMAYLWRGYCYHNLKRYLDAKSDYTKGLEFDPHSASLYLHRADTKVEMDWVIPAEDDYDMAVRLDPKNGICYFKRGYYHLTHRFNRIAACEDFAKAKELKFNVADSLLIDCSRKFSEADSLFYKSGLLSKQVLNRSCSCPSWIEKFRNADTIVPEYKLYITDPNDELFQDDPDNQNDDKPDEVLP